MIGNQEQALKRNVMPETLGPIYVLNQLPHVTLYCVDEAKCFRSVWVPYCLSYTVRWSYSVHSCSWFSPVLFSEIFYALTTIRLLVRSAISYSKRLFKMLSGVECIIYFLHSFTSLRVFHTFCLFLTIMQIKIPTNRQTFRRPQRMCRLTGLEFKRHDRWWAPEVLVVDVVDVGSMVEEDFVL